MHIVSTRQLLSVPEGPQDVSHLLELNVRGCMAQSVDDHPLTDQEVAANRHGAGQKDVADYADESSIAHRVAHVGFEEGDIVLIVGPLPEVVEGSIEEAVHDSDDPGEVGLFEEVDDDEEQVDWRVVDHFEDEGLDLVTDISDGVDLFPHIQLRHRLLVLFAFPDNHLQRLPGYIHVVKDQVAVGEHQRQPHHDPAQDVEAQPFQSQRQQGGDDSRLQKRSQQHLLQFDALGQYSAREGVSVKENASDPGE